MPKYDYDYNYNLVNKLRLPKCNSSFFGSIPTAERRFGLFGTGTAAVSYLGYLAAGTLGGAGLLLCFGWLTLKEYAKDKEKQNKIIRDYLRDDPDCYTDFLRRREESYKKYGVLLGASEDSDLSTRCNVIHNAVALRNVNPKPLVDAIEKAGEEIMNQMNECLRENRRP